MINIKAIIILISLLEGFSPIPYDDANGQSIGYGHFIQKGEHFTRITESDAIKLVLQDIKPCLSRISPLSLPENQTRALTSLCYNIGVNAFKRSTLFGYLTKSVDIDITANEFDRWIYSEGEPLKGLIERRSKEKEIFLGLCLVK